MNYWGPWILNSLKVLRNSWGLFVSLELELWIVNSLVECRTWAPESTVSGSLANTPSLCTSVLLNSLAEIGTLDESIRLPSLVWWTVLTEVSQLRILEALWSLVISLLDTSPANVPALCSDYFRPSSNFWASLVAQMVKNLLAMQETQVWSLEPGRSPGEGSGYHSSILAKFLCSFPSSLLADAIAFCL